jgi:hypothetical protein
MVNGARAHEESEREPGVQSDAGDLKRVTALLF